MTDARGRPVAARRAPRIAAPACGSPGARPRTLGASVAPVLVGTAAAVAPTWPRAIGCLVVALALQVGVNYANDYFDGVRKVDTPARVGPVRLTASGLASPRAVRAAAAGRRSRVAGGRRRLRWRWRRPRGCCSWAPPRSAPRSCTRAGPSRTRRAAWARCPCSCSSASPRASGPRTCRARPVPAAAWWGAVAVGLLAVAILVANNLRDIATDAAAGKRTLAVRLGDRRTRVAVPGLRRARVRRLCGRASRPGRLPAWALLAFAALRVVAARPFVAVGSRRAAARWSPSWSATAALDLLFGVLARAWACGSPGSDGARAVRGAPLASPWARSSNGAGGSSQGAAGLGGVLAAPVLVARRACGRGAVGGRGCGAAIPARRLRDAVAVNAMIPRVAPADAGAARRRVRLRDRESKGG